MAEHVLPTHPAQLTVGGAARETCRVERAVDVAVLVVGDGGGRMEVRSGVSLPVAVREAFAGHVAPVEVQFGPDDAPT